MLIGVVILKMKDITTGVKEGFTSANMRIAEMGSDPEQVYADTLKSLTKEELNKQVLVLDSDVFRDVMGDDTFFRFVGSFMYVRFGGDISTLPDLEAPAYSVNPTHRSYFKDEHNPLRVDHLREVES